MNPLRLIKAFFTSSPRYTPRDCQDRVLSGEALLVDVRESNEWSNGVAEKAVLLPFSDLTGARIKWQPFLAGVAGRELLFYCGAGVRSAIAARVLANEGFRTANAGSFKEWNSAGWPIDRTTLR
jgi:rhodanese-related sulfurtransferase